MNVSKKILIYILVGFLSICSVTSVYCRSVYAIEWAGGALAFEEALKWALALMGITATAGMTDAYWDEYGDDFTEYAIENGATQTEVANWQLKLCEGILDKGSSIWSSFKAWAKSLVSGSESGSGSGVLTVPFTFSDFKSVYNNKYNAGLYQSNSNTYYSLLCFDNYSGEYPYIILVKSDTPMTIAYNIDNEPCLKSVEGTRFNYDFVRGYSDFSQGYSSYSLTLSSYLNLTWKVLNITNSTNHVVSDFNSSGGDVADENFQTVQDIDQANLDVISSLVPDEDASEVTIPMPGVGTSDNTASADAYDYIVDQINSGTISLEDGLSSIQEILKVIVYDEVTDEVVPPETDPDTGENKTKEDAIKDNKNNMGFSLAGLENVFPFCIPFDIYAFMSLLVADPEAPVFEIPFPNIDDPEHPLTQEVDLSAWDDAMALFRLAEDFVFIIGLMFATRSLIGAGGGD